MILICTFGNLSITQSLLTEIQRDLRQQETFNLHTLPNLYNIARYLGSKIRLIQEQDRPCLKKMASMPNAACC